MTDSSDNVIFDRLVDGELSPLERQQLLASLDSRPDGWRQCALAFLEAQAWRAEMKSMAAHGIGPVSMPATLTDSRASDSTRAAVRPLASQASRRAKWLESSLALAATALLVFTVGWYLKAPDVAVPNQHTIAANDAPAVGPAADPREDLQRDVPPRDAVTLVVQDTEGKPRRLRLPLVDAAELGDQWAGLSTEVPVDLRADLRSRGFELKSKQRFAPLFFEQNKRLVPMVVPVSDTYVVPVEQPVY